MKQMNGRGRALINHAKPASLLSVFILAALTGLAGCGGGGSDDSSSSTTTDTTTSTDNSSSSTNTNTSNSTGTSTGSTTDTTTTTGPVDISNKIFENRSADCADYVNDYDASVTDIKRDMGFAADVTITSTATECTISSDNIPNHDFNDATAGFATNVAEVSQTFTVTRSPALASTTTAFTHTTYNAIMLNGVPLDILSAGCYDPTDPRADADGNTAIGCSSNDAWLLDPLGTDHKFGADAHNAHTQPNGSYHYHGNPNAMFDTNPGPDGSPVIGFAADGFPVYGSFFKDATGVVRKAVSGYTLKAGSRPSSATDPGGSYDGTYNDDYEFTNAGDLDACNGMTVGGQYGYYVTDTYPWVMKCFSGTPHSSFNK